MSPDSMAEITAVGNLEGRIVKFEAYSVGVSVACLFDWEFLGDKFIKSEFCVR